MPSGSVIIPTYNRKELLTKTLDSLFNQTYPRNKYEVVVVDDGSTDGTEESVRSITGSAPVRIRYFKQKHSGPAAARNVGINEARGEIIAFTDDDCIVDSHWISEIVSSLNNKEYLGVNGPIESELPYSTFVHSVIAHGQIITSNLALRKEVFARIGLFDPSFRAPWGEDEDLTLRLEGIGGKIYYNDRMKVRHPPYYQSFWTYLKKTRFFQYDGLLDHKYPGKGYAKKHRIVVYRALRKILYLIILCLLPIPQVPIWGRLLFGLGTFWAIDFYRLRKMKRKLNQSNFKVRVSDQISFTLLNWLVNLSEAYYLIFGILKYSRRYL